MRQSGASVAIAAEPVPVATSVETPNKHLANLFSYFKERLLKCVALMAPAVLISVTYADPGNYSTAVAAGAAFKYSLLCTLIVSQVLAILFQVLASKLAIVTEQSLPVLVRQRQSRHISTTFWIVCELSLLAADIAQVIGVGIGLNLLFRIPLEYGIAMTIIDVIIVAFIWRPDGTFRILQWFEYFVAIIMSIITVSFMVIVANLSDIRVQEVFKNVLPTAALFRGEAVYASMSILGAIVMPHALVLGTCLTHNNIPKTAMAAGRKPNRLDLEDQQSAEPDHLGKLPRSAESVRLEVRRSAYELSISLMTIPLIINGIILIIAARTIYDPGNRVQDDADLYSAYHFVKRLSGMAMATTFALAVIFSGISAGIAITFVGENLKPLYPFVQEFSPWQRRLITRGVLVLSLATLACKRGHAGVTAALNGSQALLVILLPVVLAPLVWYTSCTDVMTIDSSDTEKAERSENNLSNGYTMQVLLWLCWIGIVAMGVASIISLVKDR